MALKEVPSTDTVVKVLREAEVTLHKLVSQRPTVRVYYEGVKKHLSEFLDIPAMINPKISQGSMFAANNAIKNASNALRAATQKAEIKPPIESSAPEADADDTSNYTKPGN